MVWLLFPGEPLAPRPTPGLELLIRLVHVHQWPAPGVGEVAVARAACLENVMVTGKPYEADIAPELSHPLQI
jgi:hypothetical protein